MTAEGKSTRTVKRMRAVAKDRSRYAVEFVATDQIKPSPENDDIYGAMNADDQINHLIESIGKRGLEDPRIVSSDDRIMSGHRRYYACTELGLDEIPMRRKKIKRVSNLNDWLKILAEFNPQRVKSPARCYARRFCVRPVSE